MYRLKKRLPEQEVILLPGHIFIAHPIQIPEGMHPEEKQSFIELSLEAVAPYPLEQLAYGVIEDPATNHLIIIATPNTRIRDLGINHFEDALFAIPDFCSLPRKKHARAVVRTHASHNTITALFFEADNPVPTKIVSRRRQSEIPSDDALFIDRESLFNQVSTSGYEKEDGLWYSLKSDLSDPNAIKFGHRHITKDAQEPDTYASIPSHTLWALDLRNTAFKTTLHQERIQSNRVWLGLRFGFLFLGFLILLQFTTWGIHLWTENRNARILEQSAQIQRLEDANQLSDRLEQASDRSLQPERMLMLANDVRPDTIYFTDIHSLAYNQLEINGESKGGIVAVNRYAEVLEAQPLIESVKHEAETRQTQTTFKMVITYGELEPVFPPEVNQEITTEEPNVEEELDPENALTLEPDFDPENDPEAESPSEPSEGSSE